MSRLALKNKAKREPKFPCRQNISLSTLWSGEGIFAPVSSVSNLFSFAQFARRYSWRD